MLPYPAAPWWSLIEAWPGSDPAFPTSTFVLCRWPGQERTRYWCWLVDSGLSPGGRGRAVGMEGEQDTS